MDGWMDGWMNPTHMHSLSSTPTYVHTQTCVACLVDVEGGVGLVVRGGLHERAGGLEERLRVVLRFVFVCVVW